MVDEVDSGQYAIQFADAAGSKACDLLLNILKAPNKGILRRSSDEREDRVGLGPCLRLSVGATDAHRNVDRCEGPSGHFAEEVPFRPRRKVLGSRIRFRDPREPSLDDDGNR